MAYENNVSFDSAQSPVKRAHIIAQAGKWNRSANGSQSLFLQRQDDFVPTGALRPCAMDHNHGDFRIHSFRIRKVRCYARVLSLMRNYFKNDKIASAILLQCVSRAK